MENEAVEAIQLHDIASTVQSWNTRRQNVNINNANPAQWGVHPLPTDHDFVTGASACGDGPTSRKQT
ncbi:hypothetical protein N9L68_00910 [bacterium]|nr:hypothetical protein [bacterium]